MTSPDGSAPHPDFGQHRPSGVPVQVLQAKELLLVVVVAGFPGRVSRVVEEAVIGLGPFDLFQHREDAEAAVGLIRFKDAIDA